MTQQFKFGDRVRRKNFPELNHQHFITVEFKTHSDGYPEITIISELGLVSKVPAECFEPIPHPDTVRLDWLADPANKIGSVILPGWCSDEYDSLRDAIDAAMQAQVAEAEAT